VIAKAASGSKRQRDGLWGRWAEQATSGWSGQ